MPPKKKYPCNSVSDVYRVVDVVQPTLTLHETEDNWDKIDTAIATLTDSCRTGACNYPEELVEVIRPLSRNISDAMKSERTRLSGTAIDLVSVLAEGVGSSFEPLVNSLVATLLVLCGRTNKVVLSRARTCVLGIVENTHLSSVLPHFLHYIKDKSASLRLIAAEGVLVCLNCLNPPDLEKEARAKEIESAIRAAARDASADVRKVSKKLFEAYKILLPGRVQSFTDPLTPTMKKYLDIRSNDRPPMPALKQQSKSNPAPAATHSRTKSIPKSIDTAASSSSQPIPPPPSTAPMTCTMPLPGRLPSKPRVEDLATQSQPHPGKPTSSSLTEKSYHGLQRVARTVNNASEGQTQTSAPALTRSGPRRVLVQETQPKPGSSAAGSSSGPGRLPLRVPGSSHADAGNEKRRMGAPGRRVIEEPEQTKREKAPARREVPVLEKAKKVPSMKTATSSRHGTDATGKNREMPPPPVPSHVRSSSKDSGKSNSRPASRTESVDSAVRSVTHSREQSRSKEDATSRSRPASRAEATLKSRPASRTEVKDKDSAGRPESRSREPSKEEKAGGSKIEKPTSQKSSTGDKVASRREPIDVEADPERAKRREARRAEKEAAVKRDQEAAATLRAKEKSEKREHPEHPDRLEDPKLIERRARREAREHLRQESAKSSASQKSEGEPRRERSRSRRRKDVPPAAYPEPAQVAQSQETDTIVHKAAELPLPPSPKPSTPVSPESSSPVENDEQLQLAMEIPLPPSPELEEAEEEAAYEEQAFIADDAEENEEPAAHPDVGLSDVSPLAEQAEQQVLEDDEDEDEDDEGDVLEDLPQMPKTPARKTGGTRHNPFHTPLSRLMYAVEHGFDQDASMLMVDDSPQKQSQEQPARMPQVLKHMRDVSVTSRQVLDELNS